MSSTPMQFEPTTLSPVGRQALDLVESVTGIVVPPWRWPVLEAELEWLGGGGADCGLERVRTDVEEARSRLLEALAIPETYLFRHPGHFDLLREHATALADEGQGCLVLSAGCSTGEEVWSAAAVLASVSLPSAARHQVVGWELNASRISRARIGRYNQWACRSGFGSYGTAFDRVDDDWEAAPELHDFVRFEPVNLCARELPRNTTFDIIFFRNVSIYWREDTIRRVCQALVALLRPGGALLVGPSDPVELPPTWEQRFDHGVRSYRQVDPLTVESKTTPAAATLRFEAAGCSAGSTAPAPASRIDRDRPPRPAAPARHSSRPDSGQPRQELNARPTPSSAEEALLDRVRELADSGRYQDALDLLAGDQSFATVPGRLWWGILQLNLGQLEEAVRAFRQCVFLHSDDPDLRRWLGIAYEASGRIREAEREYRNAEEMSP